MSTNIWIDQAHCTQRGYQCSPTKVLRAKHPSALFMKKEGKINNKRVNQTWSCPPERQDPASYTEQQAPVPSTRKPTQPTEPTLATGDRHQKQQELRICSLWKGDPKHSKWSKMRRQRNTQHIKEQGKNPPNQTNEEEIGSLPEKEFRIMIVKMIQKFGNRKYKKHLRRTKKN